MKIRFEELSAPQRAGGIEAATQEVIGHLKDQGVSVIRSSVDRNVDPDCLPDCVHAHGIWAPYLARRCVYWRRLGIPCIVSLHGMLEPWALASKRWKKKIAWHLYQSRILNSVSSLHATSKREEAQVASCGLKAPTVVIPWGVTIPKLVVKPQAPIRTKVMLFVGRIYPVKGLPMLVEAWAQVRPVAWRVRLVGPDEAGHRSDVEKLIRHYGLEDVFEFAGKLEGEEKEEAFREADVFVLPSHAENFGMVIGEALARGIPVITTQATPWEKLDSENCGWCVPASIKGLTEVLRKVCDSDAAELREMGIRGRKWMERDFRWDRIAAKMRGMYQELIDS